MKTTAGRIQSAEAALAAAEAALADLDLVATINGSVVKLDLIAGEQVTPGTPVVQLADFSQWYVETDNLTEIDVVNVSTDQAVSIVPDALPDVQLSGKVESIGDVYEEKRGDVTYTARILVNEVDPRLRWGMTVVVTFEK
jgi:multidrug resistance efflux pump